MTASIPRATYRLQLHKDFDFAAAQAILPYLQALGVSHVYCSPITRARPGSLHGYDVTDPREISPELGGREGFERFAMAARALDLQLLLDIVPNHMGVIGSDNPWWDDVLAHGQASAYAGFFDIDWRPLDPTMAGKLLLPLLGAPYGEVLERGELQLRWEEGAGVGAGCFVLAYFTHRVATDPGSWGAVLRLAADQAADADTAEALTALAERADAMPPREDLGAAGARERAAAAARLRQQLLACMAQRREAERAIDAALAWLNGAGGRDALHALLEVQAWRLGFWRVAADEINYRRFFDINELAALCVEDEQVFEATHALALDLTAAGIVDGLRIDHPDGLRDPAQYFARLQDGHARRRAQLRPDEPALPEGGRPLYVVAEKITAAHADLPQEWRLHGTTGYRFGALLNGLFSDRSQAARMERVWRGFTGAASSCEDMVFDAKLSVAQGALGADLSLLATQLKRIASANRRTRDYGFTTLRSAIAEVAAAMPVYRTYVVEQAGEQDQRFIDWAVAQARRRSAIADASVFDFLRACLLAEPTPGSGDDALLPVRRFAWRFQQFCAPLAAKGVEDCVFYRYLQLVSLNEVGGDPTAQGLTVQAFHGASADRAARWPHTLLATSTHDNKRSEDVRNRIAVLSERPALWRLGLMRWHQLTRSLRRELASGPAPSRDDELLLYQVLLGVLPSPDEGDMDAQALAALRARVGAYMAKAAREAKLRTSWVRPDADYEQALQAFVDGLLGRLSPNPALADLRALARQLAWFGALNSLSMVVLKLSAPGVPDIYQGNEMQDLSLVDPDNRRPVDYALRQGTLAAHEALLLLGDADRLACLARMAATPADGRLKLWATWRLLALRREDPALLCDGAYIALRCSGRAREHVVAYARRTPEGLLVVLAARLFARLLKSLDAAPVGEACWGDASVDLTPALKDWNGGAGDVTALELLGHVPRRLPSGPLRLADALQTLPVAVYWVDARAGKQGA